jgi:D-arabinose 5-phosphate isomerase GutQ
MQEAQDSILAVCKGGETTVTVTIVLLVKKRETNLILLREEGN